MQVSASQLKGTEFQQAPEGTYPATCIRIVDLGTQSGEYQGQPYERRQLVVTWELSELMEDGRPFICSKFYTASLNEKSVLHRDLVAWRNKPFTQQELNGFELNNIIGKSCLVQLVKNSKGKVGVNTIMALPKGIPAPEAVNETYIFDIETWDQSVYAKLSDGIKRIIGESKEAMKDVEKYSDPVVQEVAQDDEIPF